MQVPNVNNHDFSMHPFIKGVNWIDQFQYAPTILCQDGIEWVGGGGGNQKNVSSKSA